MKQLNSYIIEKLKINKDTKAEKYNVDDKIIIISLTPKAIFLHPIGKIQKISENEIIYVSDKFGHKDTISINSNGYAEHNYNRWDLPRWMRSPDNAKALYLPVSKGLEMIKKVFNNYNKSEKDNSLLLNYFDKKDKSILDNNHDLLYIYDDAAFYMNNDDYNKYVKTIEDNL